MNIIPVLLYHSVSDNPTAPTAPFSVTPADFALHMDAVIAAGYRCLTVSQYVDSMPDITEKVALVTFDDGYLDFIENAAPVMATRGIPSTIYITSGFMEGGQRTSGPDDPMMSWTQLLELAPMGVEIGAHSHSHPHMDTLTDKQLRRELTVPKNLLEDCLGERVRSFAYPHGYNGPRVRRLTQEVGYDSAAGVRNMFSHPADDIYNIARLTLTSDTTVETVTQWLDGKGAEVATSSEALQTRGWRMYRRSKALVTRKPVSVYV